MAWTTPRTWVTNELVTAVLLNQQLRDNLNALKSPPGQQVDVNSNPTVNGTTWVDTGYSVSLTVATGPIMVFFNACVTCDVTTNIYFRLMIDNINVTSQLAAQQITTDPRMIGFLFRSLPSAGLHTYKVQWRMATTTGTAQIRGSDLATGILQATETM